MVYLITGFPKKPREFYRETCNEYAKRIGRFRKIKLSQGGARTSDKDWVAAISPNGAQISSEEMAGRISAAESCGGFSRLVFALNPEGIAMPNEMWALMNIDAPMDLQAALLLEQIYRARKILSGEAYHK